MGAEGVSPKGFAPPPPEQCVFFVLKLRFMYVREEVSLGQDLFTDSPSLPPLQSNPLEFVFQSTPPPIHVFTWNMIVFEKPHFQNMVVLGGV